MIKASELRIGNWIKQGSSNFIVDFNVIRLISLLPKNSYEGIPLTPELLVKCGFEKIPHYTVTNSLILNISRNRHLSIGCVGTPNEMLWLCNVDGKKITDLVCLNNFDYDGKLYVHKLQNFIHLLTGEELTIDLTA